MTCSSPVWIKVSKQITKMYQITPHNCMEMKLSEATGYASDKWDRSYQSGIYFQYK